MPKLTWSEKMKEVKGDMEKKKMTNKGLMYISSPREIENIIRKIPKGKLITTEIVIKNITSKNKVDFTCPLTSGIFISICANYAEEEIEKGVSKDKVVTYWRVIKPKGFLYDKYLGTKSKQEKYLKEEGYKLIDSGTKKGKMVKDYDKFLN